VVVRGAWEAEIGEGEMMGEGGRGAQGEG